MGDDRRGAEGQQHPCARRHQRRGIRRDAQSAGRDAGGADAHPAFDPGECPGGAAASGGRERGRVPANPAERLADAEVALVPNAIQIGPLALPVSLLFMLVAVAAATSIGKWSGRRVGVDVEPILFWTLVVGVVVARLAFVLQFSTTYQASPLAVLDIRDGGWRPLAGFAAAWLFALGRQFKKPMLRKPLLAAVIVATAIWGGGILALSLPSEEQKLPTLELASLEGAPVDLAQFEGRPTVVNLWATWCPPCVREMPVLREAQAAHPAMNFVFINQGESAQRVGGWLAARNLLLRNVLLDTKGQALTAFNQRGLPTTLFFDAKGRLVSTRTGELSAASLAEKLESID
ncbi:redoxin domain-containing protein [Caenimonas sedimenti]|uniref:Redoxin domain-containing protein n=1 Tax=Caenimonas sedimenti TaxID=2596921 RepID=A0A562ZI20_9BURK|nr:redoxin domain-containing protein [Caenimonas sedimenti]